MNNVEVLGVRTETLGQHLRKLAQRADLGELQSGSMCFVQPSGYVVTSWWMKPGEHDIFPTMAAMDICKTEMVTLVLNEGK